MALSVEEIRERLTWLQHIDSRLSNYQDTCGLPETVAKQLQLVNVIQAELEKKSVAVGNMLDQAGAHLNDALRQEVSVLRQKWSYVRDRATNRSKLLQAALVESIEFQEKLQALVDWLTETEISLADLSCQTHFSSVHRNEIGALSSMIEAQEGNLKGLLDKSQPLRQNQRPDATLVQNLLVSVDFRYERVKLEMELLLQRCNSRDAI